MTNRLAIILGVLILLAVGVDIARNDSAGLVFVLRKLLDLIEYLAFWR